MTKHPYQAYTAAMQTLAGTRQVVMLYDGVLRHLQQAADAMRENRIEARYNGLSRASEIIFGLQSCLDFEQGGDVANILYSFYSSIDARIFALHRSNSAEACEALIAEIRTMRDTWDQIDRGQTGGGDPAPAAPPPAASAGAASSGNVIISV